MNGDVQLAWDTFQILAIIGISIGVVLAIISSSIKIGLQLAPWIFIGALIVWFLGN